MNYCQADRERNSVITELRRFSDWIQREELKLGFIQYVLLHGWNYGGVILVRWVPNHAGQQVHKLAMDSLLSESIPVPHSGVSDDFRDPDRYVVAQLADVYYEGIL